MPTIRTKRLLKKAATDKQYLDYLAKYNARTGTDKQPMTRYHWGRSGRNAGGSTKDTAHLRRKTRKSIGMKD